MYRGITLWFLFFKKLYNLEQLEIHGRIKCKVPRLLINKYLWVILVNQALERDQFSAQWQNSLSFQASWKRLSPLNASLNYTHPPATHLGYLFPFNNQLIKTIHISWRNWWGNRNVKIKKRKRKNSREGKICIRAEITIKNLSKGIIWIAESSKLTFLHVQLYTEEKKRGNHWSQALWVRDRLTVSVITSGSETEKEMNKTPLQKPSANGSSKILFLSI